MLFVNKGASGRVSTRVGSLVVLVSCCFNLVAPPATTFTCDFFFIFLFFLHKYQLYVIFVKMKYCASQSQNRPVCASADVSPSSPPQSTVHQGDEFH